ncbi:AraC-like DNA-binding protein [Paenibacillus phyllosphaerae]|uniref:AraC-like DNA-binding protein n=1 Tax=Paenibacillus phyllosphaerae TaxID=274593 RepID=A0A7W5AYZ6_9BACL|nr:helix-turn-helix domain-containing protein [Paenibacillus phyllosphaerae]MBB3111352.1 AraC-like DNA-binding protein [Paenibacillus phyllosphaerae]
MKHIDGGAAPFLEGILPQIQSFKTIAAESERILEGDTMSSHTLLLITKAKGELIIEDKPFLLSGKSAWLLLPGMRVEVAASPGRTIKLYRLSFDLYRESSHSAERKIFELERSFPVHGLLGADLSVLQRLILRFESAYTAGGHFLQQHVLMELLAEVLNSERSPELPAAIGQPIELTIRFMQESYQTDIKLEKLAELAGMHPSYYSQLFKQRMNKSPIEFLTQLRMNKAKELLLVSGPSVREVASQVGYQDEFYFSRRFKENSGVAPTHYLKRKVPNVISLSFPYTDHLFALGVTPCAAQIHPLLPPVAKSLKLPFHAYETWEIGRQAFLSVKPDLVLCKANVLHKAQEHIGDVAPIIAVPWKELDLFGHMKAIAELLGREKAARDWISQYEAKADQARGIVQAAIGSASVTVLRIMPGAQRIYAARNIGHVFYRALQLPAPAALQSELDRHEPGTGLTWLPASLDELGNYESDYLLLAAASEEDAKTFMVAAVGHEAWLKHPAVRANRVRQIDWANWMIYAPNAILHQLGEAVQMLAGKRYDPLI